jgi:hypothetical protein
LADDFLAPGGSSFRSISDFSALRNESSVSIVFVNPAWRGDKATHGKVLVELNSQMASKPVPVDLLDLSRQLGVVRGDHGVTFDNRAALASIRASIC